MRFWSKTLNEIFILAPETIPSSMSCCRVLVVDTEGAIFIVWEKQLLQLNARWFVFGIASSAVFSPLSVSVTWPIRWPTSLTMAVRTSSRRRRFICSPTMKIRSCSLRNQLKWPHRLPKNASESAASNKSADRATARRRTMMPTALTIPTLCHLLRRGPPSRCSSTTPIPVATTEYSASVLRISNLIFTAALIFRRLGRQRMWKASMRKRRP